MDFTSRNRRTLTHIRTSWPTYLVYVGSCTLLIAVVILSVTQGWYSFVILALVALVVVIYFLALNLWSYHVLYDNNGIRDLIFKVGELHPQMTIVDVSFGLRDFPAALSRRLTTGVVVALDVYNPQLAPSRSLARAHSQSGRPEPDPRLSWRDGHISLLPLPDNSVHAVTLVDMLSELWQEGDRYQVLREIRRILLPGGFLLLVERVRTPLHLAILGPAGFRLKPTTYWVDVLAQSDLRVTVQRSLRELSVCIRAEKPLPDERKPLPVDD